MRLLFGLNSGVFVHYTALVCHMMLLVLLIFGIIVA